MIDAFLIAASLHFDGRGLNRDHYNQVNPGIMVQADYAVAAVGRNSLRRPAALVGGVTPSWRGLSLMGGVVRGYPQPFAAAVLYDMGPVRVMFTPKLGQKNTNVIVFEARVW